MLMVVFFPFFLIIWHLNMNAGTVAKQLSDWDIFFCRSYTFFHDLFYVLPRKFMTYFWHTMFLVFLRWTCILFQWETLIILFWTYNNMIYVLIFLICSLLIDFIMPRIFTVWDFVLFDYDQNIYRLGLCVILLHTISCWSVVRSRYVKTSIHYFSQAPCQRFF